MTLKGLLCRKGPWKSLHEMKRMFNFHKSPAAGEGRGLGLLTSSLRRPLS